MAAASGKHKDTYRATAVFLVLTGLLYLIDKWVGFGSTKINKNGRNSQKMGRNHG